ncbi:hypothetical protein EJ04DRAFT_582432 [Polyplosphaeria fusca]|uniref:Multicopper oxidase n=1 Tax=Polyplosphaeria fusca TaxID=682080 RepID=A0A9P4QGH8_9PLEO|nr:hypothetical protein EJ04DRAFT_582432 [Polyplosphaeria fusca]
MVAFTPYLAGAATLSTAYALSHNHHVHLRRGEETCATPTYTFTYTEFEYLPTAIASSNAHGHGGPYYNPYNDLPYPFEWPGKPTNGEKYPPPQPTAPYEYGGPAKDDYDAPAWIPKGSDKLIPSLSKEKQNGGGYWGELDCPHLPSYLPGGPSYSTSAPPYPTASASVSGHPSYSANSTISMSTGVTASTSYSSSISTGVTASSSSSTPVPACPTMPDTGVTRTYDMRVSYQTIAPDGVTRNGLVFNGQFPGPLVEANWGDWILFKVTNDLTDEGTTIHAHGLFQKETSWYDGVPAVAQCPITPNGGYFEQLFRADRYGSSWYHSHYSAQYSGGAHGPMVIYGPVHEEHDIDLGPVVLEDWYHADYFSLVNRTMNGQFPPSNNNLINGKMNYPCANTTLPCEANAGISKFKFESGKKHLIRLINAGAEGVQKFSIDGHTLKVIALDFIPVEPYETNVVTVGVGQRTDIIVEAVGSAGDAYWMRSSLGTQRCTLNDGVSPNAVAAVYYEDADTDSVPDTESDVTADQLALCKNDDLTLGTPLCEIPLEEPTTTNEIEIDWKSNGTNFVFYMDGVSYRGDYGEAILLKAKTGDLDFKPEWNVHDYGSNKTVRIYLVNFALRGGHPMHLHGHDFHVLAEGYGDWDGTVTNAGNTVRRDTHLMPVALNSTEGVVTPSYMVLQFEMDNPGAWPFHCHLAWHVSGGLFMTILERPDDIRKQDFDPDVFELCDKWDTYVSANPPNQIDSGLKARFF